MRMKKLARAWPILFLSPLLVVPAAMAQVNVKGQWSTLTAQVPINPVHAALLPNGKVLIVAGSGFCPPAQQGCPGYPNPNYTGPYGPSNGSGAALYDPGTGTITQQFTIFSWDPWCNGTSLLPNGQALIVGGTVKYDTVGEKRTAIFDPSSLNFKEDGPLMAHGRWYPTTTTLGDGRVMAFSGLDENNNTNRTVEIYDPVSSIWSPPQDAGWNPPLYPWMHLLPNGKVFYSGSRVDSYLFDPSAATWSYVTSFNYPRARTYGTSVLLPLTPANNYNPKVMIMGGDNPATNTTEIIDLGTANPTWQYGPSMSQRRIQLNAVILPNSKVLALGGSRYDEASQKRNLSRNADLYDPATNTFSSAGANAYPRLYHSVALLLPDATVWVAGGNPSTGSYEPHMEIYKPAYLFQSNGALASRPSISSAPTSISWGQQFTVQTPNAASIALVVLVRPGAVTHAFNTDQRLVGMSFTKDTGVLTVTAPPNTNIAVPGYYMLFLVDNAGVPSLANFIQLKP